MCKIPASLIKFLLLNCCRGWPLKNLAVVCGCSRKPEARVYILHLLKGFCYEQRFFSVFSQF